ncbi:MAG: tRNA pseudouridine(13) synthase TruD [Candidatus Norongarragalinales archaeon]
MNGSFRFIEFSFKPEEFVVEEIAADGSIFEVDKPVQKQSELLQKNFFTRFVLQKKAWNTEQALHSLASFLHAKPSRFNYAGTKDRNAITTQLCSAFAIPPDRIMQANGRIKDLRINGAWVSSKKVRLGDLQGNRFTITLNEENCGVKPDAAIILAKAQSHGFVFPNFFGLQRFGSLRKNTAEVGGFLLKGDFQGAVLNYLSFSEGEKDAESVAARKTLAEEKNFADALAHFPKHLKYEHMMLEHLAKSPNDFVGALGRMPRHFVLMFIHAFQSRLFNEMLEERVREGGWNLQEKGLLVGGDSVLGEREKALLEREGLSQDSFKIKQMPFLSSKGGERNFFAEMTDFKIIESNGGDVKLRFSLESGCYATVALSFLLSK